ncbi:pentapeptide repeat-containing protein [Candidatus Nitrosocosmicus arcticus]|nr:pentapeptide repeat-containing protein [Candidatus Nitrosocosmicus arcticus]
MQKCSFSRNFTDIFQKKETLFQCDEIIFKSNYCIFHNPDSNGNGELFLRELEKKINDCQANKQPLLCIGYNFPKISFQKTYDFRIYFNYSTFMDEVNFNLSSFLEPVVFDNASFRKEVEFHGMTFHKSISFSHTIFNKTVSFDGSKLSEVFFWNSTFRDELRIAYTQFQKKTSFIGPTFFGDFIIYDTEFHGSLSLTRIICKHRLDIEDTIFKGYVSFSFSNFYREVDLTGVTFDEDLSFQSVSFHERISFRGISFGKYVSFNNTRINKPRESFFGIGDMSNAYFIHTDISELNFDPHIIWGNEKHKYKILPERLVEENLDNEQKKKWYKKARNAKENTQTKRAIPWQIKKNDILTNYRHLRENYEFNMRYEEASQFFIREMEIRRIYADTDRSLFIKKKKWAQRHFSLIAVYNIICNYGESYKRPLFWIGALTILSSSIFFVFDPCNGCSTYQRISEPIQSTLSDLFQTKSDNSILDFVIRVLSIPLLGTLFIALRRKFERRFRH